jgi:copper chaperone
MLSFQVGGMACEGCAEAIQRVIAAIDPTALVAADFLSGRVDAQTHVSAEVIAEAIRAAGYEVAAA